MIFICPFSNKKIQGLALGNYIRFNYKKYNLSIKEFKFKIYKNTFGDVLCSLDSLKDLYENKLYSIPDFQKKFNINATTLFFLLDYFGIKKRTIQESSLLISKVKNKKTCNEKYGVDNPSQIEWVKDKKAETFTKHYGVDNIWKHEDYQKWVEDWYLEKYNLSRKEIASINSKKIWLSKTPEEKEKWLLESVNSDKAFHNNHCVSHKGYNTSKLEDKISIALNNLLIPYLHPFCTKISNKKRYFYDFLLKELKIVIEVNGDYWHANPLIYPENHLMHYKFKKVSAKDIWEKDKIKNDYIISLGYNLIIIWEKDIKKLNIEELTIFLKQKINI